MIVRVEWGNPILLIDLMIYECLLIVDAIATMYIIRYNMLSPEMLIILKTSKNATYGVIVWVKETIGWSHWTFFSGVNHGMSGVFAS